MKILFIDHTPFVGGAELALVRHIEYLDKRQFGVVVVCAGTGPACRQAGPTLVDKLRNVGARVFVISFEKLKTFNPRIFLRLLKSVIEVHSIIKNENVNLVVTNTERAMYVGTLAAVLARKKLVWWVRDFEYSRLLFGILGRFAGKIICVSEAIRDYYGGASDPKFEVVYVGSDFDEKLKHVSLEDVLRVKEELGLTGVGLVVGYVGRLVEWKGAKVLVEAVRNIQYSILNIKFVIVGSGEGQEGNIEPELRQLVKEYGLEKTVILTGQRNDVPTLVRIFDVFCHTSIEPEPFATVVVEAMMAGVPVVATNIGGTPEIIRDGQTGFLVPPNDPQKLAAVLSYLTENQKLRQKVGREGQRLVMAKNTEAVVTKQVEEIYNEIS